ncbi:metallophosphoesterase [Hyphomonas sp.]|uniref:metallophosphoesterase family protein n=1 Tax=Hyphomonas sp. TaxID=87 RepID=UPI0025C1933A|nr:metallophosphoesterase [Hyphomonas sp.]
MTKMISKVWRAALAAIVVSALVAGCNPAPTGGAGAGDASASSATLVRFAVIGDAEPKPEPAFPGVEAAVRDINALAERGQMDFVIGVGDLAHKGTVIQYDNVTPILQALTRPFFPIMGNEEHNESVARYLDYAARWNAEVTSHRYVHDRGPFVMVHASPDFSRDFNDEGVDWILAQMRAAAPKPVFLVVHGAQTGVYPENPDKGVANPRFAEVIAQPNLSAVISGDLHMDMDRTGHSKRIGRVHYLHMPALERTKIPDESRHTPMFRVFTVSEGGQVRVDTYQTGNPEPLERLAYSFSLENP